MIINKLFSAHQPQHLTQLPSQSKVAEQTDAF